MARRLTDRLLSFFIASTGAVLVTTFGTALAPCAFAEMSGECAASEVCEVEWRATTQDVYADGELRQEIRTWSADDRLALWLPDATDVLVAEDRDGELRLLSMPKASWSFEGPRTATSKEPDEAPGKEIEGIVRLAGENVWIRSDQADVSYLVTRHEGTAGPLETDELWKRAPVWKDLFDAYEPDPAAVEAFADEDRELELTVIFGTWCGDSRRSVPRLLKTLERAANPRLGVRLVSIDRGFDDSLDVVRREQITNVPTVIVRLDEHGGENRAEREIGRFVERPRSETVESDLAAILAGRPLPPHVSFDDTDRLLASAVLGLFDGDRRIGEERWRVFATEEGGHRLYAERRENGGTTETWLRLDEDGRAAFAEVTRRSDHELSRTRFSRRGEHADSLTRGDATGIVRQDIAWPADAVLLAPGLSGVGLAWRQADRPVERRSLTAYALASASGGAPGRLEPLALDRLGTDPLPAAPIESSTNDENDPVDVVALRVEGGERSGHYRLHRELDMPLAAELDDGRRVLLESLEIESREPAEDRRPPGP